MLHALDFFHQLFFSNRVACSEVREFEYRDSEAHYMETSRSQANGVNEMHLHIRLEKLLTLGPDGHQMLAINSLMLDGKWSNQESSVKEVVSTARVQSLKKLHWAASLGRYARTH
jgi:calmodulin-binding transcription activator